MTLSKIRQADKKTKRERKRKLRRLEQMDRKTKLKVSQRRMRKFMIQGRKEHHARRRSEAEYINNLEGEIKGGKT